MSDLEPTTERDQLALLQVEAGHIGAHIRVYRTPTAARYVLTDSVSGAAIGDYATLTELDDALIDGIETGVCPS